jgi:hypothetical protein
MKKLFAILAIAGALTACNSSSDTTTSTDSTTTVDTATVAPAPMDTATVAPMDTTSKMSDSTKTDTTKK